MSSDAPSGIEKLENGFRNLLKNTRNLPGKIKLNTRDSPQPGRPAAGAPAKAPAKPDHSPRAARLAPQQHSTAQAQGASNSRQPVTEASSSARAAKPQPNPVGHRSAGQPSVSGRDEVPQSRSQTSHRINKFQKVLGGQVVDMDALHELSWSGIPSELRPLCWKLLLGYLPPSRSRQAAVLARKRQEYREMVTQFYDISNADRLEEEVAALRQVVVDVPRTAPTVPFFQQPAIAKCLERLLYIWGIRHPASGYVQGMNDLVTPFIAVFLSEYLPGQLETWSADTLSEVVMLDMEADCYWCLSKMLDGIQDHYTDAQPGIQRTVFKLKELIRETKPTLVDHLDEQSLDFLQFAFRWVNCLLIRELPFALGIRLWDTYLAEGIKFSEFLVYVCAALMEKWADMLLEMDFQDMVLFLQRLPTSDWDEKQMELILTNAYILRAKYAQGQIKQKP